MVRTIIWTMSRNLILVCYYFDKYGGYEIKFRS